MDKHGSQAHKKGKVVRFPGTEREVEPASSTVFSPEEIPLFLPESEFPLSDELRAVVSSFGNQERYSRAFIPPALQEEQRSHWQRVLLATCLKSAETDLFSCVTSTVTPDDHVGARLHLVGALTDQSGTFAVPYLHQGILKFDQRLPAPAFLTKSLTPDEVVTRDLKPDDVRMSRDALDVSLALSEVTGRGHWINCLAQVWRGKAVESFSGDENAFQEWFSKTPLVELALKQTSTRSIPPDNPALSYQDFEYTVNPHGAMHVKIGHSSTTLETGITILDFDIAA